MLEIVPTRQFQKDLIRTSKRDKNLDKIGLLIDCLAEQKPLPIRYNDHTLTGNYSTHRECHVEPDWLLIYKATEKELILVRTGTHSDLFK